MCVDIYIRRIIALLHEILYCGQTWFLSASLTSENDVQKRKPESANSNAIKLFQLGNKQVISAHRILLDRYLYR